MGVLSSFFGSGLFVICFPIKRAFEVCDTFAEGFAELWEAARAEQYDNDDQDEEHLTA